MGAFAAAYVVVLLEGIPASSFTKDKSLLFFAGRYITPYQTRIKSIFTLVIILFFFNCTANPGYHFRETIE